MKFPITRESLQAFDPAKEREELKEEEIQKSFTQNLDGLCKEFKQNIQSYSKEKRFVWRNLHAIRNLYLSGFSQGTTDEYLPRFIEKVKETFIDCDIIIDPLKTYLIIDWS
jgi:hypothetical protein